MPGQEPCRHSVSGWYHLSVVLCRIPISLANGGGLALPRRRPRRWRFFRITRTSRLSDTCDTRPLAPFTPQIAEATHRSAFWKFEGPSTLSFLQIQKTPLLTWQPISYSALARTGNRRASICCGEKCFNKYSRASYRDVGSLHRKCNHLTDMAPPQSFEARPSRCWRTNPPYPQSDWSPIAPENSPTPFQDVSLWSTSDLYRGGPAAGARSPKPIDSLNLGFAGQPNQCLDDRTPIHQPLLSSGVLKPKTVQHRVAESAIEDAEVANRAPRKAWYRPNPYLYYRRFWKPQEVLAIAPWDEFATAKPFSAAAALPPRTALQPHPKMTTSSMEPSTDLEKGELRPLLAPTTEHDANEFADEPIDAANEATTASLLTTIATSTSLLCSALLISLYRHPLWLQRLLDLSRMPCSHPQHQPSHFITEIPRPVFIAACLIFVASATMLYLHRRQRGDMHQDALLAAGVLMGVTAGLGLGFGVEDVVRVAGVWAVSAALVGSAVGHEVLALVTAGEEEEEVDGDMEEMVGRRGSVMSAVAGEFGGVWRERGARS